MSDEVAKASSSLSRRFKTIAMVALPLSAWERLLRLPPVRALRDALVGPSDPRHLAEGPVRFERLRFQFAAPYRTWMRARQSGIENRICRLVLDRCRDGSVAVDVGASNGFISVVMAMAVSPGGRVLSFEANAAYFELLQRNIRSNGLQNVCEVFCAFVGRESAGETRVTLDDIVRRRALSRLDVLKVDVDGPDLDVLHGARETLKRFRPLVVVEMSANHDAIYRFLKDEIGYSTLIGMSGETVQPGNWPPNLIAGDGPIAIPARGSQT